MKLGHVIEFFVAVIIGAVLGYIMFGSGITSILQSILIGLVVLSVVDVLRFFKIVKV